MSWTEIAIEWLHQGIVPAALAFAAALAIWPAIHTHRPITRLASCVLAAAMVVAEGIFWPHARIIRGAIAVVSLIWALRIYSYFRSPLRQGFLEYVRFLSIGMLTPHLVYSPKGHRAQGKPVVSKQIFRIGLNGVMLFIVWYLYERLVSTNAAIHSWIVNDIIVTCAFVFLAQAAGQIACAAWRLLGIQSHPIADNILFSLTPAEFWRRWSWPIHLWLYRYIYIPAGGKQHRSRAIWVVFFISAVQHEFLAGAAIGRVTGHQTAFFMLNALGVIASPAMERLARRGLIAEIIVRFTTILFLGAVATLMFTTFNYIFPIYNKTIWLMW